MSELDYNMNRYILVDKEPVIVEDLFEWAKWYETADRSLALASVKQVQVSTAFLALPAINWDPRILLFETMLFQQSNDKRIGVYEPTEHTEHIATRVQYETYDEAIEGHHFIVNELQLVADQGKL